jgi:[FeFe] hydrogenase (group B1/B3)
MGEIVAKDGRAEVRPEIAVLAAIGRAFCGDDPGKILEAECAAADGTWLRGRILAALGFGAEKDDGAKAIGELFQAAMERTEPEEYPLTVLADICDRCPAARVHVTDLCRNCTAHRCHVACPFGAIELRENAAAVSQDRCKKCELCAKACPYGAIRKTVVPCESACPVDAVKKDSTGACTIDFDRCISCGRCFSACPFHAISFRSQIVDVLRRIREGREVIALFAPSLMGQVEFNAEQLHGALRRMGFAGVYEVAVGAEETARVEAEDLREHLGRGQTFLTTSCCAAYKELVERHLPEIRPYVSTAGSPLHYTAHIVRERHPGAISVFLSPCFAKFREARADPNVDLVLSFLDVAALLEVYGPGDEVPFAESSAKEARAYPLTGAVACSVQAAWGEGAEVIRPAIVDGLDRENIKELRRFAKEGRCDRGNLVEVMACCGGCIGGPATLCPRRKGQRRVEAHAALGAPLAPRVVETSLTEGAEKLRSEPTEDGKE